MRLANRLERADRVSSSACRMPWVGSPLPSVPCTALPRAGPLSVCGRAAMGPASWRPFEEKSLQLLDFLPGIVFHFLKGTCKSRGVSSSSSWGGCLSRASLCWRGGWCGTRQQAGERGQPSPGTVLPLLLGGFLEISASLSHHINHSERPLAALSH